MMSSQNLHSPNFHQEYIILIIINTDEISF